MLKRFTHGWAMVRMSWGVIGKYPKLLLLPVLSFIALIVLVALVLGPAVTAFGWPDHGGWPSNDDERLTSMAIGGFIAYLLLIFIVVFFNAALVSCALTALSGETPSLRAGLSAASKRAPQILAWAAFAATVGVLLNMLESVLEGALGWIGSLFGGAVEIGWAVTTYFVVPVLIVEGVGPVEAVKRSAALLRKAWGGAIALEGGLVLVGFLLFVPAVLLIPFAEPQMMAGIAFLVVAYGLALSLIFSAFGTIFHSAAYLYAATGQVPAAANGDVLCNAFRAKKK